MKAKILLLLFCVVFSVNSWSHDKITLKTKESFHTNCQENVFCTTFDLIELNDKATLRDANQFIKDNQSIIETVVDGTLVNLYLKISNPEKSIYQKLFYLMGLREIEILEGDAKGVYSVDEFLNLYNF